MLCSLAEIHQAIFVRQQKEKDCRGQDTRLREIRKFGCERAQGRPGGCQSGSGQAERERRKRPTVPRAEIGNLQRQRSLVEQVATPSFHLVLSVSHDGLLPESSFRLCLLTVPSCLLQYRRGSWRAPTRSTTRSTIRRRTSWRSVRGPVPPSRNTPRTRATAVWRSCNVACGFSVAFTAICSRFYVFSVAQLGVHVSLPDKFNSRGHCSITRVKFVVHLANI